MTIHGLIFWCFEGFLICTYGDSKWREITRDLELGFDSFVPLFRYEAELADRLVSQAAQRLDKPPDTLLEDFGTYLVADKRVERVRRLLRFGGVNYTDFLHSLDDLRGRAQLAISDLDLPVVELDEISSDEYQVTCRGMIKDSGHVLLGILRALADDYGALAFVEHLGSDDGAEVISVRLLEMQHGEGRAFHLTAEEAS